MKKFTLFFLLSAFALTGYSKTWNIVNVNFTFSPATQTIQAGDSVKWTIANIHTVVEVSQTTWNNNGNTPLSGGFSLPFGGGTVTPAKLTVGTHWYVCSPHASGGMKGMIIVEQSTATEEPVSGLAVTLTPNPTSGNFHVAWDNVSNSNNYKVDVLNLWGQVIYTRAVSNEDLLSQNVEINLFDYPKGIYIVRIHDGTSIQSRKLILE